MSKKLFSMDDFLETFAYNFDKIMSKGEMVVGKLNILVGDIVSDEILAGHDVIVNPTNPMMLYGSGVCGAIFLKAGVERVEQYIQEKYKVSYENVDSQMKIGEVRVTPGYDLGMDILFVQGPNFFEHDNPYELLFETYENMLKEIARRGYKKVLCPSLGTGIYGYRHEDVGEKVVEVIKSFVEEKDIDIDLVLYKEEDKKYYE